MTLNVIVFVVIILTVVTLPGVLVSRDNCFRDENCHNLLHKVKIIKLFGVHMSVLAVLETRCVLLLYGSQADGCQVTVLVNTVLVSHKRSLTVKICLKH